MMGMRGMRARRRETRVRRRAMRRQSQAWS
jgi:hypothetical protein